MPLAGRAKKRPWRKCARFNQTPQPFKPQLVTSLGPTDSGAEQNHLTTKSQTMNLRRLMGIILQWRKSLDYPTSRSLIPKKDWDSPTETEKQMCEKKVDDACLAMCRVIAPSSSEKFLKSYITCASRSDNELEALTLAYRQAPTKSLKTQILSIYALRFTSRQLKAIHTPF